MNKQNLDEKKLSIEQQFNTNENQIKALQEEQLKLSGEYRLVEQLLEQLANTPQEAVVVKKGKK